MMDTNITILERFTIAQDSAIGALSGVIALDDALYLVGDDVRYLAKTTLKNRINSSTEFEKIPLFENDKSIGFEPLIKAEKPDFEALTTINLNGQQHILIMGSGSTEKRKQALLYNPSNHGIQTLFNAVDYQFLEQNLALTGGAELNIEAVCADALHLYIFQRGNINRHHGVLLFELAEIQQGKSLEQSYVQALNLQLPNMGDAVSGISDAYYFAPQNVIVATAAVEQTLNTYDDGLVLGSFIVVLSTEGKTLATQLIQDDQGQPLAIKVEGITWIESTPDGEVFLLVTDSDGGDSEVLTVLIKNSFFTQSKA